MVGLLSRDDWSKGGKHKVNAWVWDQVGLELSHINVESTIKTERCGQRGDDLSNQTIEVGVGWSLNVQGATADVVDSLIVEHDRDVRVLQEGVGGEDRVVRLNDSSGDLWGWIDSETKLGLLAIVNRETLQEEGAETRTGTTTDGIEDEEALEASAIVGKLADSVEAEVDNFLTNGVVTTGKVVGGIFLARDELFWVEELTVGTGADLINDGWLEIDKDATWDVLSSTSLREEGVEGIVATTNGLVRWHLAIWLDAVSSSK